MKYTHWTNEDFLNVIREWSKKHDGAAPSKRLFDTSDLFPSVSVYQKRFGSWGEAVKLALTEEKIK